MGVENQFQVQGAGITTPCGELKNRTPSDCADWRLVSLCISIELIPKDEIDSTMAGRGAPTAPPGAKSKNPAFEDCADLCIVSFYHVSDEMNKYRRTRISKMIVGAPSQRSPGAESIKSARRDYVDWLLAHVYHPNKFQTGRIKSVEWETQSICNG